MVDLVKGAEAPDFELTLDSGDDFRLSAQRGSPVVLFFYPQDDTEGCTVENLEFSQLAPQFRSAGVRLLGISPDSVQSHCKFREKYGLAVALAADADRKVVEAYGLWRQKKTFGVEYVGLVRTTFLIDPQGMIAQVWTVTRIKGHAAEVLKAAQALSLPS